MRYGFFTDTTLVIQYDFRIKKIIQKKKTAPSVGDAVGAVGEVVNGHGDAAPRLRLDLEPAGLLGGWERLP
jgi:hypothetical protein